MRTRNLPKLIMQNILRKKIRKELFTSPCCPSPAPASLASEHKFSKKKLSAFHFFSLFFSLLIFNLFSEEVGGHLTEDTIWSPDNNPYIVTETLFVDSGVTLTILPGTMVKVNGALLTSYAEYIDNFWLHYGVSIAKYIQVDGRIIAEGTAQDSIIFTRLQDDPTYNWGSLRISEGADLSFFKYCHIEHTANIGIGIGIVSRGLEFDNGRGSVRNCTFLNNAMSIYSESVVKELEIIDNVFIINSNINPGVLEHCIGQAHIFSGRNINVDSPNVLICNNQFEGYGLYSCTGASKPSFAYNSVSHCTSSGGTICLYYKNVFVNCSYAISGGDSLYIKNNHFIDGNDGINIDYSYVEVLIITLKIVIFILNIVLVFLTII